MPTFVIRCIILSLIQMGNSANILFYFGVASYSHQLTVWPLVEELAARGHSVTVISGFPHKHISPNVTVSEVNPESYRAAVEHEEDTVLGKRFAGEHEADWDILPMLGEMVCEIIITSSEFKVWLAKTKQIDLVLIDGLFNECGLGIAHKYSAKFIFFPTSSLTMWAPEAMGTVPETSWIPDMQYHYKTPISFLNRVYNTLRPLYWQYWVRQVNYFPKMESMLRKELDIPNMPPLKELERNTSLVFVCSHYSIEYARTLPPFYIPIGGVQIVDSDLKLQKDISNFIDGSGHGGVIYVSFGSIAKVSKLPEEIKTVLYEVFGDFKNHRFIWKFDIDRPKVLSDNIMTVKWAPQQKLLAHKKIKAFISHAGCGSIQESTYYGVPMIVFPLFAQQDYNANIVEQIGCGIKLEIVGITKERLRSAIKNIIEDDRYKSKMMEASNLFRDRPMKPLETAVWWTEYVLRHKDMSALKPMTSHQTWYERRLLDVWLFIFSVIMGPIAVLLFIIARCLSGKSGRRKTKSKKS